MSNSMGILHHFSCNKCSGWWSIATEFTGQYSKVIDKQNWYCPWCGEQNERDIPVGREVSTENDS